jgi:predicted N-acyltransferase
VKARVLRSIDAVPARDWDGVCRDAVFSHAWFRALEASAAADCEPRHIALEANGRLVGALACFVQRGDPYDTLVERVFGPLARIAPRRALAAYSPLAQRTELWLADAVDLETAVRACTQAMDAICREEGIGLAGWPFVRAADTALARALAACGHRTAFLAPSARWLNPPHASFDGYVDQFKQVSRKRYKDVRHELNRFERSGVRLEEQPLAALPDELLARYQTEHYARHNDGRPSPFTAAFFAALKRELGARAVVHTARRGDELLSYSIVLQGEGRWHMFLSGDRDEQSAHADKLHFNLNFYYPIRRAIECGARQLDYGLSTYESKLQRGCVLEPVHVWLRPHTAALRAALPVWLPLLDAWYRRKHAHLPLPAAPADPAPASAARAWQAVE